MNADWVRTLESLAGLRQAFDRSFAEAPTQRVAALHDLLDIRLGGTPYALRVSEIAGLFADVKITPVPTPVPELLGIAAFRGSILAVYDLHALIEGRVDARPRWVAIGARGPIGLAFDRFEGLLRVDEGAMVPQSAREDAVRYVREVIRTDGVVRPIISIRSVMESVTSRIRSGAPEKE